MILWRNSFVWGVVVLLPSQNYDAISSEYALVDVLLHTSIFSLQIQMRPIQVMKIQY